jgi:hypothetical protein
MSLEIAVMLGSGRELALGEAPTDMTADGGLAAWAAASGRRRASGPVRGELRFVFYGRVSTEDWQDPVTSLGRQREQAEALVCGHGRVVAEFCDVGESRSVAWGRRPQAAVIIAALADPDRGWDAVVIGEYERAFYGSQYAMVAPLLQHYGVKLWMPEAGGKVDFASEHDERAMTGLGLSSKREVTRTSIRVRTAMATPHLPALHQLLTGADDRDGQRRRRTRRGAARHHASPEDVIAGLRDNDVTLTFDSAAGTLHAEGAAAIQIVTRKEAG